MALKICIITYQSKEYEASLQLRDKILRRPLGMSLFDEDLKEEANDWHIGAFSQGELVGILILTLLNETTVKMRQVAVVEDRRGVGIGSAMVDYAEHFAKTHGYLQIKLHARENAIPFYEKKGYGIISDFFTEVTLPHKAMTKTLL